jgi:hypothetical protein
MIYWILFWIRCKKAKFHPISPRPEPEMPDKRNYKRFIFENSVFLKFESDPAKAVEGKLLDISLAGLSIFIKQESVPDAIVQAVAQFDFADLSGQHLVGKGRVVHAKNHKLYSQDGLIIGLEYTDVDKDVLVGILNQLESRISDQLRRAKPKSGSGPGLY